MTRRRIATRNMLRHLAGGLGLLMVGFGTFLVASYVVGSVQVMNEADRSWLFWGLALAFQGATVAALGGLLVVWGHMQGKPHGTDAVVTRSASVVGGTPDTGARASAALPVLGPDDEVPAAVE